MRLVSGCVPLHPPLMDRRTLVWSKGFKARCTALRQRTPGPGFLCHSLPWHTDYFKSMSMLGCNWVVETALPIPLLSNEVGGNRSGMRLKPGEFYRKFPVTIYRDIISGKEVLSNKLQVVGSGEKGLPTLTLFSAHRVTAISTVLGKAPWVRVVSNKGFLNSSSRFLIPLLLAHLQYQPHFPFGESHGFLCGPHTHMHTHNTTLCAVCTVWSSCRGNIALHSLTLIHIQFLLRRHGFHLTHENIKILRV